MGNFEDYLLETFIDGYKMGIRVNLFPDARKIVNVPTRGRIQIVKE